MTILVYQHAVSVKLIKLVQRTNGVAARYVGSERDIDLTPFLGESAVVRTTKALDKAAGGFSIAFGDQMDPVSRDTVYALVEPMDMIEIRAARQPHLYAGQKLPLIMRGFVSSVRRPEAMSGDGTPNRSVVIMGQDAGKLWLIHAVWWQVAVSQDKPVLDIFRFQAASGMDTGVFTLAQFVTTVTQKIMNPKVAQLSAVAQKLVPAFTVQATVAEGAVIPEMAANFDGPLWNLIDGFAERPWNELFIQDTETGPVVVFRPAPFKGIDGKQIADANGNALLPGWQDPGRVAIDISTVVSHDVMRSDARVANFFWVPPGNSMLDNDMAVTVSSLIGGDPLDFSYGNNLPALYGERKMTVETRVIPDGITNLPSKLPDGQKASASQSYITWHQHRAAQLKAMNRDNSVFEEGSIVAMGSEMFQIGTYLQVTRSALISEAYMTAVSHTIPALAPWTTTIAVERGTGFLSRSQIEGSPYIAEGRPGLYETL